MSPLTGEAGLTQINRWESSLAPWAPVSALITGAIHTEVKKKKNKGGGMEGRRREREKEVEGGRESIGRDKTRAIRLGGMLLTTLLIKSCTSALIGSVHTV